MIKTMEDILDWHKQQEFIDKYKPTGDSNKIMARWLEDEMDFKDMDFRPASHADLLVLYILMTNWKERYSELLDSLWLLIYPGDPKSWEYPGQVFNHIRLALEELKEADNGSSQEGKE